MNGLVSIKINQIDEIPGLFFLFFESKTPEHNKQYSMATIKKNGEVEQIKKLPYASIQVRLNASNIFLCNYSHQKVEIYDFKLNIVHEFMLNKYYHDMKLSDYDMVLFHCDSLVLTFYNCKTKCLHKNEAHLNYLTANEIDASDIANMGRSNGCLFDLNDKFIILANKNIHDQTVYVFNRADFGYLYKCCVHFGMFFSFNEQLGFNFYKIIGKKIEIYNAVETGVNVPESVVGIINIHDLIRFFVNNNNTYAFLYKDTYIKPFF